MTKSQTATIQRQVQTVLNEIQISLHISVDSGERMRLENFVGGVLISTYYNGVTDGLQKAREIHLAAKGGSVV